MKLRVTLKQVALCLVAGMVTTVVVAWGGLLLADCLEAPESVAGFLQSSHKIVTRFSMKTTTHISAWQTAPPRFGDINWYRMYVAGLDFQPTYLVGSTIRYTGYATFVDPPVTWTALDAGWPFLSLRGWSCVAIKNSSTVVRSARAGLIENVPTVSTLRGLPQTASLPYCPRWPGFIANTLFYAALWWLLFTGLITARAARRSRRGLCTRCAYDLRGIASGVCPECGQARPT